MAKEDSTVEVISFDCERLVLRQNAWKSDKTDVMCAMSDPPCSRKKTPVLSKLIVITVNVKARDSQKQNQYFQK